MEYVTGSAAVFFIDMLGMTALTSGNLDDAKLQRLVSHQLYDATPKTGSNAASNQRLAVWILLKFREILGEVGKRHPVQVAQLSDCAFIWSPDVVEALLFASEFMWSATLSGLLCRGGLSYGQVITPVTTAPDIGRFVLGDAVTKAAGLERTGKGCRVFTDPASVLKFQMALHQRAYLASNGAVGIDLFSSLTDPLTYTIADEFKWYCFDGLAETLNSEEPYNKDAMAMKMALLVAVLKHSPYFAWNALNQEGLRHLIASINAISTGMFVHSGNNAAALGVEFLYDNLGNSVRSFEALESFLNRYQVDALSSDIEEETRRKLCANALALVLPKQVPNV